jgi:hypothetical protein
VWNGMALVSVQKVSDAILIAKNTGVSKTTEDMTKVENFGWSYVIVK